MKHLFSAYFILGIISFSYCQTSKFYIGEGNSYSVLIDKNASISKQQVGNGSATYFIVNDSASIFKYYFSIASLIVDDSTDVYGQSYIDSFKKECSCNIVSFQMKQFNNIEGLKMTIKASKEGNSFSGYSIVSRISENSIYSISFLTLENKIDQYKKYFYRFINSFVVNTNYD